MWVGLALEDFIVPSVREASRGHVYLILTMRAVLALRVVRVLHLTKRFESMKVSGLSSSKSNVFNTRVHEGEWLELTQK